MKRTDLLTILSIWLTADTQVAAQGEHTGWSTEFVTEPVIPTRTSTAADSGGFYTTCDFDLENIENLLPYLPDICTEIYYNRTDNDLYALYLEEAQMFDKFYKKLRDYELRHEAEDDNHELTKYPFEAKVRNDTYSKVDWLQCIALANSSTAEYLKCVKGKRVELTELIPDVEK